MCKFSKKLQHVAQFFMLFGCVPSFCVTPYKPQVGWSYNLESRVSCRGFRFLSFTSSCRSVDFWKGAGVNQAFTLVARGPPGQFYIKLGCGRYLSYPSNCRSTKVGTWPHAGINQAFRIGDAGALGWSLEAVGRSKCADRFVGYGGHCSKTPRMHPSSKAAGWNAHAFHSPLTHVRATRTGCADPFAWKSVADGKFRITCTGGNLGLWESTSIKRPFAYRGGLLGGTKPAWARSGARWAPENIEVGTQLNIAVFSDQQKGDKQRVGWSLSRKGPRPGAWSTYSKSFLNLGNAKGGEIDAHIFTDDDKSRYLVWKTDDNSVGSRTTRIWAQKVKATTKGLSLMGPRRMIMDSSGLWWVDSWVRGGSLVEGPEIVRHNGYYYLFFAAGRYCQTSYAEGVARSQNVLGPYKKLGVPFLSTGMVGTGLDGKIIGPGHASYVKDKGVLYAVWHASEGHNCKRRAYANEVKWSSDGWPYVDFQDKKAANTSESIIFM